MSMIRRFKKWYLDLPINKKLSFILIPSLLVLVAAVSGIFFSAASTILTHKIEEQALATAAQISDNFDRKMEIAENKMVQLMNDPTIQEELKDEIAIEDQDKDNYYSNFRKIRRVLIQVYNSPMIEDIEIYADNGDDYYISVTNQKQPVENEAAYLKAVAANNGGKLVFFDDEDRGNIQLLQQIKDELTGKRIGILRLALKKEFLYKPTATASAGQEVLALYAEGRPIFMESTGAVDKLTIKRALAGKNDRINHFFTIKYDSAERDWTTYLLLDNGELFKEIHQLKYLMSVAAVLIYLIALLLINRISRTIVGPIEDITTGLKNFVAGDLSVRLPQGRGDELGTMSSTFNYAVGRIESLIDEVSNMKKLEKELEYKTLQAQINPHFLYNTLDTIYWMALTAKEQAIAQMILSLSNLMRNAIDNNAQLTTIRQEMKVIKDYLYIQQIRHQDKLQVSYDVDEELFDLKLPKLSLQPLVENAVNHGLMNQEEDWQICVSLQREEGQALLRITDNGIGIDKDRLSMIRSDLDNGQTLYDDEIPHVGFKAVHQRLRFLYGSDYGLVIESTPGNGTRVTLVMPLSGEAD